MSNDAYYPGFHNRCAKSNELVSDFSVVRIVLILNKSQLES